MLGPASHVKLLKLLLDARVSLQTAEHLADCEHSFGYAHDLEQLVYELDMILIAVGEWQPRRRATRPTGS